MNIFTPVQLVPDLVEELVVDAEGKRLDPDTIRWIVNEFDDHAIEQAILLKEQSGGKVTVLAPDLEGADDVLFQAAAKGADRLVKLAGDFEEGCNTHALARRIAEFAQGERPDLILTGVHTHNSLDGALGPMLAALLGWPFVDCVAFTTVENGKAVVRKEYPGGLVAEMEVSLPAVLGIQSANTPPRYVPISKIRLAMKSSRVDEEEAGELDSSGEVGLSRMYAPEVVSRAEMIEGGVDEVAERLVALFKELTVL